MSRLLIIGAGGHGKVVADAAVLTHHWDDIFFLDDHYPEMQTSSSFAVKGKISEVSNFCHEATDIVVAIGDNTFREKLLSQYQMEGLSIPTIIHPNAYVSTFATLAEGVVVFAGAVVNAGSTVGLGCIINSGAIIEHDCQLEAFVHVSPNAALAGGVSVGRRSWIGMGSNILGNVSIGNDVTVGAGSVVLSNVPNHVTLAGVPARIIKDDK